MIDRRGFLASTLAATAASLRAGRAAGAPALPEHKILRASGRQVLEGDRPVRLRGVNLGGWMLIEDYMIGLPWTEWKIREQFRRVLGDAVADAFFGAWAESYVTDADVAYLARQGFTFVRLPFNYRQFESDLAPGKWREDGFRLLDRAVSLCRAHGLWVLLDLHAGAGAQARDQNAGSAYGETYFWQQRGFMDRTTALWVEIARRYRDDPAVLGYNLLGEPVTDDVALLNEFYLGTTRAIRAVDPSHLIVLDSNRWAKDVSSLQDRLFEDPQVVPALHHYYFDDSFFPRLTQYPGKVDGHLCDRVALERTLDGKHDERRIGRPVFAAEFGVTRSHAQPFPVQLAITRDLVSIFEEKGWAWALWCYKDLRDMGLLTPRRDTPWRRFVDSPPVVDFLAKYDALEKPFTAAVGALLGGTDVEGDTREQWAREVRRDFDAPALDFVLRRLKGRSPDELAAMARSFAFESCEVHEDQLGMLTPFLGKA
jgi:endoglucanase